MTIDEHFIAMILLEAFIFGLGIYIMARGQKKQTDLIEKVIYNEEYAAAVGKNMLFGIMKDITEDPEKEQIFTGFLQGMSINAVDGVKRYYAEHGDEIKEKMKDTALKGMPKEVKTIAKVADFLGIDIKGLIKGQAQEVAEEVAGDWIA